MHPPLGQVFRTYLAFLGGPGLEAVQIMLIMMQQLRLSTSRNAAR